MKIYQRNDIVANRHKFLREIERFRLNGHHIFYQDETWCNTNHIREKIWQQEGDKKDLIDDTKWKGGLKFPSGVGKRLINLVLKKDF